MNKNVYVLASDGMQLFEKPKYKNESVWAPPK